MVSQLDNVSFFCRANVYFDGKVVSHGLVLADGEKKSVGIIYPGSYSFDTAVPERMEIIAGTCSVKIAGESDWTEYKEDTFFDVPADSSFEIAVKEGIAEYLCSYK